MTVKHAIAAWLCPIAGFALVIAGAPWPWLWMFLGALGCSYACAPEPKE